jgi:3-phenylpropionate/cinnamic acid dioxygenase small subunit
MTHQESTVRSELRALVEDYAWFTDQLDYEAWVGLFLPDAEFSASNPGAAEPFLSVRGAAELETVPHMNDHWVRTFHHIGNHRVSLASEQPTGVTYCMAHHLIADSDPAESFIMLIKYHDEYALTDDGWRFASRHLHFAWQEFHRVDASLMGGAAVD